MPRSITVRSAPILLDQLLAAELGPVAARDLLPLTLALNPDLADAGPVIPIGRTVLIPERPAETRAPTSLPISLFG